MAELTGTEVRKMLSFICFDELCIDNGFLLSLISAMTPPYTVEKTTATRDNYALVSKTKPNCNETEGGFAWWRKSRQRFACCVLLHASCGWYKSHMEPKYKKLYVDVLTALLENKLPYKIIIDRRVSKMEDMDLASCITLVGGYTHQETTAYLDVFHRVMNMTDECFLTINPDILFTVETKNI